MLEQAGCASVISIEGNPRAFLKCLVLKEVVGLSRSRFLCGDFVEYLRGCSARADVVVASGVLYHMMNPVELLYLISRVSDCVFLWTHYYDEHALSKRADIRKKLTGSQSARVHGFSHTLFR